MIRITVEVEFAGKITSVVRQVTPAQRVSELIRQILQELSAGENADAWELVCCGQPLPSDVTIEHLDVFLAPMSSGGIAQQTLRLRRKAGAPGAARPARPMAAAAPTPKAHISLEDSVQSAETVEALDEADFKIELDHTFDEPSGMLRAEKDEEESLAYSEVVALEADEEEFGSVESRAAPARKPRTGHRRATVRHYDRMNPERVYPLVVFLTEQMVKRISKSGTDQQASGPFEVDLDMVVEVEPVLPGCVCYPPKATARLDAKNLTFNFHVVPHVLGKITGAKVLIRQDHRTLVEVELKANVVQRTIVLLCGVLTFLLPFLSSLAKHFGLDFQAQQEVGFSPYLAIAHALFQSMSPLVLTALLAGVTGWFYWRTRPKQRDTFWDLDFVSPGTLLRKIADAQEAEPKKAAHDLADLMRSHPAYQPALLFYANWQRKQKNFKAALQGYERAFRLGAAKPEDYLRGSLAASQLRLNEKALAILQLAVKTLPAQKITGVIWYNMGCYHARLGQLDSVLGFLRKAVQAGYRKPESYSSDPDLNPVRTRPDFQQLLKKVGAVQVTN